MRIDADTEAAEAANFAARNVLFEAKQNALSVILEEARRDWPPTSTPYQGPNYVRMYDALEAYGTCDRASRHLFRSYLTRGV